MYSSLTGFNGSKLKYVFVPPPLPTSNLLVRYDLTNSATLYTDTSRTTPANVGDYVRGITDLQGNFHGTAAASGPVRRASGNRLELTGTPFQTSSFAMTGGALTIAIVAHLHGSGALSASPLSTDGSTFYFYNPSGYTFRSSIGGAPAYIDLPSLFTTSKKCLYVFRMDGSNYPEFFRDGTLYGTAGGTITALNIDMPILFGNRNSLDLPLTADFYEVLIYNSRLSDGNMTMLHAWSQYTHGTT